MDCSHDPRHIVDDGKDGWCAICHELNYERNKIIHKIEQMALKWTSNTTMHADLQTLAMSIQLDPVMDEIRRRKEEGDGQPT